MQPTPFRSADVLQPRKSPRKSSRPVARPSNVGKQDSSHLGRGNALLPDTVCNITHALEESGASPPDISDREERLENFWELHLHQVVLLSYLARSQVGCKRPIKPPANAVWWPTAVSKPFLRWCAIDQLVHCPYTLLVFFRKLTVIDVGLDRQSEAGTLRFPYISKQRVRFGVSLAPAGNTAMCVEQH